MIKQENFNISTFWIATLILLSIVIVMSAILLIVRLSGG